MTRPAWRPMTADDVAAAHALSQTVHPGYPEARAVFAERHQLYPQGCFALVREGRLCGYALSHPFPADSAPALDTLIGALPREAGNYYIHDVAMLQEARGHGAASAIVERLKTHARAGGFACVSLIAVNDSAAFWTRHEFAARAVPALAGKLASYGAHAVYMRCALRAATRAHGSEP
ncbi:MAG: GNAT family N-acetyltransferase [Pseudorhodoplanes sp.]|nr:hypothetical protein [Pseudorhodoplanes sp.]MBW7948202.1 GNAT family N-acetyltransferase [Pseudorhodoplanes sp.]MCL4710444.1 GNAT family N-acetyltransferase [Pseudorhodoplanes sp.]GIK81273.1 MAG: N-acetyltransferase [Alphaproteobacteria bacterium]